MLAACATQIDREVSGGLSPDPPLRTGRGLNPWKPLLRFSSASLFSLLSLLGLVWGLAGGLSGTFLCVAWGFCSGVCMKPANIAKKAKKISELIYPHLEISSIFSDHGAAFQCRHHFHHVEVWPSTRPDRSCWDVAAMLLRWCCDNADINMQA